MRHNYSKTLLDLFLSLCILPILIPLLVIISVTILIIDGRPVFYLSERMKTPTKGFILYKFRTMEKSFDNSTVTGPDKSHMITRSGFLLRKTKLDELPQILNVIKGDISFIGPRPLLIEYLSLYNSKQIKRHDVLPGISGYAQVNGRNSISWNEKFKLDIYYVQNQSFYLDLKIFILTIKRIVTSQGVNSNSKTSMEKFNGKN